MSTKSMGKEELDEILDININGLIRASQERFDVEEDNEDWNPDDPADFANQFGMHLQQDAPIEVCFVCEKPIPPSKMGCLAPCGHAGCWDCLRKFFPTDREAVCPLCRRQVERPMKVDTENPSYARDLCQICVKDFKNLKATVTPCGHVFCITCAQPLELKDCYQCKGPVNRAIKLQVHVRWTVEDWKCKFNYFFRWKLTSRCKISNITILSVLM